LPPFGSLRAVTALADTIQAQGRVLSRVLELELEPAIDQLNGAERIWLVGTGTSQHAAELGAQMFQLADADARPSSAAAFARLRASPDPSDAIVLITHTGETAFARAVRQRALQGGCPLVSITGVGVGWDEALEVAPREVSETYTASYTAALLALARLSGALGAGEFDDTALGATVDAVGAALDDPAPEASARPARLLVIAGVGAGATTAREGALKLREAARVPAEGFEAEYLLHGSAVLLGTEDQLLLLQPDDDADGLLQALGPAARAEGVDVQAVEDAAPLDPLLLQIPLTVRLQLLAAHLAEVGGYDPDAVIEGAWRADELWSRGAPSAP
jgi:glutamine---fructose-6-phosphate transaminase (isomerizing)